LQNSHFLKDREKIAGASDHTAAPPPDFPDISPCDFWSFGWSKDAVRGQMFNGSESIREFLMDLWCHLVPSTLMLVYRDWIERLQKVIAIHADYCSK
jgi:hypothetical protein